jgi:hypothetical protein
MYTSAAILYTGVCQLFLILVWVNKTMRKLEELCLDSCIPWALLIHTRNVVTLATSVGKQRLRTQKLLSPSSETAVCEVAGEINLFTITAMEASASIFRVEE